MKTIKPLIFLFALSACSMTPEQIAESIDECGYYGLQSAVIVRNDAVKRVNCYPDEDLGYLIVEDDFIKLPELPRRIRED